MAITPFCRPSLPRPRLDQIDGAGPALSVLDLAIAQPIRSQTIALLLDHRRRGRSLVVTERTELPEHVLGVLDKIAAAAVHQPQLAGLVLASVRPGPGGSCPECSDAGLDCDGCSTDPLDIDRWLEMSATADRAGIELVEWFVIGPGTVSCPRDLLGEPPRW